MSDSASDRRNVVRMPAAVSAFGPFLYAHRTGRLERGGAEIHLTPRASDVLRLLLDRRGEIVAKDELFAEVWRDVSVTDDALLQVVSAVRKALGDDPRSPEYIQTVTGEGYRFIGEVEDRVVGAGAAAVSDAAGADARDSGLRSDDGAGSEPAVVAGGLFAGTGVSARQVLAGLVVLAAVAVAWGLGSAWFSGSVMEAGGDSATNAGGPGGAPDAAGIPTDLTSIAVLPFDNMSGDSANDYLGDGIAEELRGALGKIDGLRVAARTSSSSFRGQAVGVGDIARQLNVAAILEGSMRKDGSRVRIVATLVSAHDGFELWTETYDREIDDLFAIQQDIAARVVDRLTVPLLGESGALLGTPATESIAAYEAYLQGRFFLNRYTGEAMRVAAMHFERALELDRDYAPAYVGLADAYLVQNRYSTLPKAEALALAEPAIERAMQLDGQLGDAWAMRGLVLQQQNDIEGAAAAYERAIELSPDSARTYQLYFWMLFVREGSTERVRDLGERAFLADPLSPVQNENMGWPLFEDGRFDEALYYFERSLELEPDYPFGHSALGAVQQTYGNMDEAIAAFQEAHRLSPETSLFRKNLGHALAIVGRADEAIAVLGPALDDDPAEGGRYGDVGRVIWDVKGDPEGAVPWFEEAIEENPRFPRLRVHLGLVHLDLGNEEEARRWIESAAQISSDNFWTQIGQLNLYMYSGRYEAGAAFARDLAGTAQFLGYLSQYDRPYSEYAPLGYFSLLAGRASDALVFPTRVYPELMDDDPVIDRFNVNAAIDLAATLQRTDETDRAELLLRRALAFVESRRDDVRRTVYREEPAEIHALLGDHTAALAALRAANEAGWRKGRWRAWHKPHYEGLRGSPEFTALMGEARGQR